MSKSGARPTTTEALSVNPSGKASRSATDAALFMQASMPPMPPAGREPRERQMSPAPPRESRSHSGKHLTYTYNAVSLLGQGAFGSVFLANVKETGEYVAVKQVLQDNRYKNRELAIAKAMDHPNVVRTRASFYSRAQTEMDDVSPQRYLNLVMEALPATLHAVCTTSQLSSADIKLYAIQMMRALEYIHAQRICHRDIKPQNLLVDPRSKVLKLCDFGSAKVLSRTEANVSYICSRYYRAPELTFGATYYDTSIDMWSAGCVLAELYLGSPLFEGKSSVDSLQAIFTILGTPSLAQVQAMTAVAPEAAAEAFTFDPPMEPRAWPSVLRGGSGEHGIERHTGAELMEASIVVSQLLVYSPGERMTASEVLSLAFFDASRLLDKAMVEHMQVYQRDADAPAKSPTSVVDGIQRRHSAVECAHQSWPAADAGR